MCSRQGREASPLDLPAFPATLARVLAWPGALARVLAFPGAPARFGVAGGAGEHTRRNFSIHGCDVVHQQKWFRRWMRQHTIFDLRQTQMFRGFEQGTSACAACLFMGPTSTQERASKRRSLAGGAVARCASSAVRPHALAHQPRGSLLLQAQTNLVWSRLNSTYQARLGLRSRHALACASQF